MAYTDYTTNRQQDMNTLKLNTMQVPYVLEEFLE